MRRGRWRLPCRPGLAAVSLLAMAAVPARAEAIAADLSSHLIAINSSFTGASVVLFGATDEPGDVIAVVRGPERRTTVWHKERVFGIWVNAASVTFAHVPSFYAVAASRPLDELIPPATAARYGIGLANLQFETSPPVAADRAKRFAAALVEEHQRVGLFGTATGSITFLGGRLFRATLDFPATVPTGAYVVEAFLVRDGEVVDRRTAPLSVSKVGLDAAVSDFATRRSALYGAIAVGIAVVAGWLASLPFRSV